MTRAISVAGISCRAAIPEDVPFLLKLREDTMATYLTESGIHLSAEESLARVMHLFECAEIVLDQEKPIGVLKVRRGEYNWVVVQFQLCPSVQGKGLGTRLMHDVIQQAHAANAPLTLSVLRNNPARRLYESLGFMVTGSSDHEYSMKLAP